MEETTKEELIQLKADTKMNELRIQAILNLLAKEGLVSRKDFDEELATLCDKSE